MGISTSFMIVREGILNSNKEQYNETEIQYNLEKQDKKRKVISRFFLNLYYKFSINLFHKNATEGNDNNEVSTYLFWSQRTFSNCPSLIIHKIFWGKILLSICFQFFLLLGSKYIKTPGKFSLKYVIMVYHSIVLDFHAIQTVLLFCDPY